jgi:hypothetical protein
MEDSEITRCSILLRELYENGVITQTQKSESYTYIEKQTEKRLKNERTNSN